MTDKQLLAWAIKQYKNQSEMGRAVGMSPQLITNTKRGVPLSAANREKLLKMKEGSS